MPFAASFFSTFHVLVKMVAVVVIVIFPMIFLVVQERNRGYSFTSTNESFNSIQFECENECCKCVLPVIPFVNHWVSQVKIETLLSLGNKNFNSKQQQYTHTHILLYVCWDGERIALVSLTFIIHCYSCRMFPFSFSLCVSLFFAVFVPFFHSIASQIQSQRPYADELDRKRFFFCLLEMNVNWILFCATKFTYFRLWRHSHCAHWIFPPNMKCKYRPSSCGQHFSHTNLMKNCGGK